MGIFDSYDFDWSYGGSPVGDAIGNYMTGNTGSDYSIVGDAINNYVSGGDTSSAIGSTLGNADWGKIINTLGRLGSGIGTGIATFQSQKQPDYYLDTQWLGNGLARSGFRSNKQDKRNMIDQLFGAGNITSNVFGPGYSLFGNSRNSGSFNTLPTSYNMDYDVQGLSPIGTAINNYVRG